MLLESGILVQQAARNTKEQFASSPDVAQALLDAVMDALAAHSTMSKQALESERVRQGLKAILLRPGQLYELLRRAAAASLRRHEVPEMLRMPWRLFADSDAFNTDARSYAG